MYLYIYVIRCLSTMYPSPSHMLSHLICSEKLNNALNYIELVTHSLV